MREKETKPNQPHIANHTCTLCAAPHQHGIWQQQQLQQNLQQLRHCIRILHSKYRRSKRIFKTMPHITLHCAMETISLLLSSLSLCSSSVEFFLRACAPRYVCVCVQKCCLLFSFCIALNRQDIYFMCITMWYVWLRPEIVYTASSSCACVCVCEWVLSGMQCTCTPFKTNKIK